VIKKVFYNGLADFINIVAGILASIVLVRLLGPERWGYYSQATWLIGFAGALFSFGLTYTAVRYLGLLSGQGNLSEARSLTGWITIVQLAFAVLGSALLIGYAPAFIALTNWKLDPAPLRAAGFGLFAFTMLQLTIAMLRGLQEFQAISLLTLLLNATLLVAVAYTMLYPSIEVLLISVGVGQLVLLPMAFWLIRRRLGSQHQLADRNVFQLPEGWRGVLGYTGFVYISMLVDQIVWQRSEMFFLAQLDDATASGYYGLAYTSAQLAIGILPIALTGTLTPIFSSLAGSGDASAIARSYRQSFAYLNLLLLPLAIGFFIIAPGFLGVLYGDAYAGAAPILRILIVSSAIGIYARPSASVLHAINRPYILLIGSLIALPIDVLLAWRLVPLWEAQGAAVANLAAQVVGAAIAMGYTTFSVGLRYDFPSLGKSAIGAAACGTVAWLITQLAITPLLSLALAICLGAATYLIVLVLLRDDPAEAALGWVRAKLVRYYAVFAG
jgi:O-antigen/teichoic acid export membrane protein